MGIVKFTSTPSCHLPEDLDLDILKRLPKKALCRLQSVRKSWMILIRSPSFSKAHQSFISASGAPTIYLETGYMCFYLRSQTTKHQLRIVPPLPPISHIHLILTVVNVINGVVCFKYTDYSDPVGLGLRRFIAFWNPSVGRHVSVSLPRDDLKGDHSLLGAGFDASNNDFKAVWVSKDKNNNYYKVFSARRGVWRKRSLRGKWYTAYPHDGGCFFDGAIYWIACPGLLYFDCEREEFGEMKLPGRLFDAHGTKKVFVYRGSLSAIRYMDSGDKELWTMKEHGVWTMDKVIRVHDRSCYDSEDKIDNNKEYSLVLQETMSLLDIGKPCHGVDILELRGN